MIQTVVGAVRDRFVLIGLLRSAGPGRAGALVMLLALQALAPAATALLLGEVVGEIRSGEGHGVVVPVLSIVLLGCVLFASHLLDVIVVPLTASVTARIDGGHRQRVMRLVARSTDLLAVESAETQKLIREVAADPTKGFEATPAAGAIAATRSAAGLIGALGAVIVLIQYSWWLVLIVFIPILVNHALQVRFAYGIGERWRAASGMELPVDVWRRATVSVAEAKDIRVFGLVNWIDQRMARELVTANEPLWSYNMTIVARQWIQIGLVVLALAPTYILVALGTTDGTIAVGAAASIIMAGWSIFAVFASPWDRVEMSNSIALVASTEALNERLAPAARDGHAAAVRPSAPSGTDVPVIEFRDVHFRYPEADRDVLRGVNLTIRAGELTGLVGLNGAGKSTLMKLLGGLYMPTSGSILVNGIDLQDIDAPWWREMLSVQFQDFTRYQLSVRDNVALSRGDQEPDDAALQVAAERSGLDRLVASLPHGWDTYLTRDRQDGVDLSGGQWQQVVLARSLYAAECGARVLALDEPTAHLDVRTEFDTFERISAYSGSLSVVLISHRLSTVRNAGQIALLADGVIAELGTHDELMARGGAYAEMFEVQAARFRAETP